MCVHICIYVGLFVRWSAVNSPHYLSPCVYVHVCCLYTRVCIYVDNGCYISVVVWMYFYASLCMHFPLFVDIHVYVCVCACVYACLCVRIGVMTLSRILSSVPFCLLLLVVVFYSSRSSLSPSTCSISSSNALRCHLPTSLILTMP